LTNKNLFSKIYLINKEEMESMYKENYTTKTLSKSEEKLTRDIEELESIKTSLETLKAREKALKENIFNHMGDLDLGYYETSNYEYNIVRNAQRNQVDSKKLKNQFPNVFKTVSSLKDIKPYIQVKKVKKD